MNLVPRRYFLEDVFNDFLTSRDSHEFKCDIYEKDNKYHIEMDAPGFKKEDLNIECDEGYLTISFSKCEETNEEEKNYIKRERNTKEFTRSFYIGDVETEEIKAELKDGSLKVMIPKKEPIVTKKTIEIE